MRLSIFGLIIIGIAALAKSTCASRDYDLLRVPKSTKQKLKARKMLEEISNTDYVMPCFNMDMSSPSCLELIILETIIPTEKLNPQNVHQHLSGLGYLGDLAEGQCTIPSTSSAKIDELLSDATKKCTTSFMAPSQEEKDRVTELLNAILVKDVCWQSFCSEDLYATIAANWMEECLGLDIEFPLSMTNPDIMTRDLPDYNSDSRLACMIGFALSSHPSQYGLEPLYGEICFPFGLAERENFCPEIIGTEALLHCPVDTSQHFGEFGEFGKVNSRNDLIENSFFSLDYGDDSYSYSYSFSYDYDDDNSADHKSDSTYIKEMCDIIDALSTEEGKLCLKPLCPFTDDSSLPKSPTSSMPPSLSPTSFPVEVESNAPSSSPSIQKLPSMSPTNTHTIQPTVQLTMLPSIQPSMPPSIRPSMPPSIRPSMPPSIRPSMPPSIRPSMPPSIRPTIPPTMQPNISSPTKKTTKTPTNAPTVPVKNRGSVEIVIVAEFRLSNMTGTSAGYSVPTEGPELRSMIKVLINAISMFLPKDATAKILRIGGIPVDYPQDRILEEGLLVDFEVTMRESCEAASCNKAIDIADKMYTDVTSDLQEAVSVGQMAYIIKREAVKEDVAVFASIAIDSDSFESEKALVKVEKKAPAPEISAGTRGARAMSSGAIFLCVAVLTYSLP